MFNVLFIDDDDFMLRALLRLAKRLRPDWQFFTAADANAWHNALNPTTKLDLVICDYLMPQVNGDKVLAEIAQSYPGAVRALLTGDTTEDVVCNASKIAHFVLSKPFNERDILQLFQSVELTHRLPVSADVREMLGNSALLMPLPSVVKKVQDVLLNDHSEAADIVDIIQHEPLITARILQLANSAFMGFSRSTASLEESIRRLGMKLTSAVITSIALEQAITPMLEYDKHRKINDAAFDTAMHSRLICRGLGYKQEVQEELFVAALLSAIGALITATDQWRRQYSEVYADWPAVKLEVLVSVFMLTLWGYTESLCQTVLWSAEPDFSSAKGNNALLLFLSRQRKEHTGAIPGEILNMLPDTSFRQKLAQI
ncbi:HD-like signal output (HDOD) domain, no enzymatic activity [Arsukibacterium tuosuense]|uniref:HD-like signal output (HDOD) domain, no enzymatic activity n=1 Tax=Arsukibacterium tuosuense TaxID=1323745 RepID=A0A285JJ69_9GAMM|nr:HDOD domain-containing protein [Arsukibacterium tuosuense]SNY60315.1 HD-like signal output (HDOD) domain, no enzymatic activity [Arsukibacterium tuosuense]